MLVVSTRIIPFVRESSKYTEQKGYSNQCGKLKRSKKEPESLAPVLVTIAL